MSFCTIESDPGVFTSLITKLGVKDVQVEELWDLSDESLDALEPVYGLIFLFKYQKQQYDRSRPVVDAPHVFFAKQIVENACATQAILSVLMNSPNVDMGEDMNGFKEFAQFLPAEDRGIAIGQSETIRKAHNSYARPEPFVDEYRAATEDDEGSEDVYHFVGYVPVQGVLYELDGLQAGPIKVKDLDEPERWKSHAREAIQKRIQLYSSQEIRFNLLALVKNRRKVFEERLQQKKAHLQRVETQLADAADANADSMGALKTEATQLKQECKELESSIIYEIEKFEAWRVENVRRQHNYVPFVFHLFKTFARRGKLQGLLESSLKAHQERITRVKREQDATKVANK